MALIANWVCVNRHISIDKIYSQNRVIRVTLLYNSLLNKWTIEQVNKSASKWTSQSRESSMNSNPSSIKKN